MKLLMISGDRSLAVGKKGAFWYTLEALSMHFDRIDVICPRARFEKNDTISSPLFNKVYLHPNPRGLWSQIWWIVKKGKELFSQQYHETMTVHDYPPFYNGIGAFFLSRRINLHYALEIHHVVGYPEAASPLEWMGYVLSRLFLRLDAKGASAVRVVNQSVKLLLERFGIPDEKIRIIHSFYLDAGKLQPLNVEKRYDVAFAARLVSNKGLTELIEALNSIPQTTLLIVGDGPRAHYYKKLVERCNMERRVTFTGWLDTQEDVMRAIQSAKIFVMNSKSEGGPRVALEAMACGMPVLTTQVGIMPDVIQDGHNGMFTTGKPLDVKEKITHLLADAQLRILLGTNARKVLAMFDRRTLIERYAQFLQTLS